MKTNRAAATSSQIFIQVNAVRLTKSIILIFFLHFSALVVEFSFNGHARKLKRLEHFMQSLFLHSTL